jgi:hypothetical protein
MGIVRRLFDPGDWLGMKPALDPEASTLSLDYTPNPMEVKVRLAVGLVVSTVVVTVVLMVGVDFFVVLVAGLFVSFALYQLIYGVIQSGFEKSLTITDTMVFAKSRSLLGRNAWEEPIANYRGVLMRETRISGQSIGNIPSSTIYHIVELDHPDSSRILPLYVQKGGSPRRDIQEAFARRFALPALTPDGDDVTARAHDALDQSIAQAPAEPIDPGPPPSGVKLQRDGAATRITLGQSRKGKFFVALFYLAVPIVFGGVAYQVDPVGGYVAAGMAAGLILFLFAFNFFVFQRGKQHETALCFDKDRIWIKRPNPLGGFLSKTLARRLHAKSMRDHPQALARDAVEQIRVDSFMTAGNSGSGGNRRAPTVNHRLLIEADAGRLSFHGGQFDDKKLEWVRDYLRFVLAGGVAAP